MEGGPHPGDGLNLVVAAVDFLQHPLPGQLGHVGMAVGMIHDFMPRVEQGLDRISAAIHPLSHHEEGGAHLVFSQNLNKLLGVLVPPGRVECQADHLARPIGAVNGQPALSGRRGVGIGVGERRRRYDDQHRRQKQGQENKSRVALGPYSIWLFSGHEPHPSGFSRPTQGLSHLYAEGLGRYPSGNASVTKNMSEGNRRGFPSENPNHTSQAAVSSGLFLHEIGDFCANSRQDPPFTNPGEPL